MCALLGRELPCLGVVGHNVLEGGHGGVCTREALEVGDSGVAHLLVFAEGYQGHCACRCSDKVGDGAVYSLAQAALCAYGVRHNQSVAIGEYGHGT